MMEILPLDGLLMPFLLVFAISLLLCRIHFSDHLLLLLLELAILLRELLWDGVPLGFEFLGLLLEPAFVWLRWPP